ncbi:MAG: hypothetical protein ACLFSG_08680, partial [Halothiobacillaceae bacterium]
LSTKTVDNLVREVRGTRLQITGTDTCRRCSGLDQPGGDSSDDLFNFLIFKDYFVFWRVVY